MRPIDRTGSHNNITSSQGSAVLLLRQFLWDIANNTRARWLKGSLINPGLVNLRELEFGFAGSLIRERCLRYLVCLIGVCMESRLCMCVCVRVRANVFVRCACMFACVVCVCARALVCVGHVTAGCEALRRRPRRWWCIVTAAVVGPWCVCVCARVCLSATALRDRAVASAVRARVCVCVRARASGTSPRVVTALRERLSACQQLNMYYTSSQGSAVLLWEHNRNLGGSHRSHSPNNKVSLLRV